MNKVAKLKKVPYKVETLSLDFNNAQINDKTTFVYAKKMPNFIDKRFVPEKFYYEGDRLYFYSGERMYLSNLTSVKALSNINYEYEPYVVSIKNNNEYSQLIFDGEKANFVSDSDTFEFYGEDIHAVVRGLLFQGGIYDFFVSKDFCVTHGAHEYTQTMCYMLEEKDGEVLGIAEYDECALILSEHKLIKISFTKAPGDIVVEKILTQYFSAKKKSLAVCGDKAVFIADEGLGVFDGHKLSFVKIPNNIEYENFYEHCSFNGSLYVFPFTRDNEKWLCVYDVVEGVFTEIKASADALSRSGAVFLGEDGYAYKIVKEERVNVIENVTEGVTTHLNYCGRKILRGIEFHSQGEAILNVSSDGGEKNFIIKEGCNKFYCNLCSENFTLTFNNKSQSFRVGEITFRYTKLGG